MAENREDESPAEPLMRPIYTYSFKQGIEWVLRRDSVTYGLASMIRETLDYDFDREKAYS